MKGNIVTQFIGRLLLLLQKLKILIKILWNQLGVLAVLLGSLCQSSVVIIGCLNGPMQLSPLLLGLKLRLVVSRLACVNVGVAGLVILL